MALNQNDGLALCLSSGINNLWIWVDTLYPTFQYLVFDQGSLWEDILDFGRGGNKCSKVNNLQEFYLRSLAFTVYPFLSYLCNLYSLEVNSLLAEIVVQKGYSGILWH